MIPSSELPQGGAMRSNQKVDPITERLRFLRPTSKFKFAKDQYYMVGEVMHEAADEIERLSGTAAELLSICIEMRNWLRPEVVKEPDRSFFWKLHERIEKFHARAQLPSETTPAVCATCNDRGESK